MLVLVTERPVAPVGPTVVSTSRVTMAEPSVTVIFRLSGVSVRRIRSSPSVTGARPVGPTTVNSGAVRSRAPVGPVAPAGPSAPVAPVAPHRFAQKSFLHEGRCYDLLTIV